MEHGRIGCAQRILRTKQALTYLLPNDMQHQSLQTISIAKYVELNKR